MRANLVLSPGRFGCAVEPDTESRPRLLPGVLFLEGPREDGGAYTTKAELVAADQVFRERDNRKVAVALLRSQLGEAMNTQIKGLVSSILVAALLRDVREIEDFIAAIPLRPPRHGSARFPVRANLGKLVIDGIR